jgi:hypothetical protein
MVHGKVAPFGVTTGVYGNASAAHAVPLLINIHPNIPKRNPL